MQESFEVIFFMGVEKKKRKDESRKQNVQIDEQ